MLYSAGDLGVEIDFGPDQPGAILQRKDKGCWRDYLVQVTEGNTMESIMLTVGAVGPQGDPGPIGPQSGLVLYDAEGDRVGTIMGFPEESNGVRPIYSSRPSGNHSRVQMV
jgi:hypothetical protein